MLLRPEVIGFLEDVLHDESSIGLLLESFSVETGSQIEGKTLLEAQVRQETGAFVVGLKRANGQIEPDLQPSSTLHAGDTVIALGKRQQLDDLISLATKSH
jgi:voltage-gated potassium channel